MKWFSSLLALGKYDFRKFLILDDTVTHVRHRENNIWTLILYPHAKTTLGVKVVVETEMSGTLKEQFAILGNILSLQNFLAKT